MSKLQEHTIKKTGQKVFITTLKKKLVEHLKETQKWKKGMEIKQKINEKGNLELEKSSENENDAQTEDIDV